jgi:hypothetical protein
MSEAFWDQLAAAAVQPAEGIRPRTPTLFEQLFGSALPDNLDAPDEFNEVEELSPAVSNPTISPSVLPAAPGSASESSSDATTRPAVQADHEIQPRQRELTAETAAQVDNRNDRAAPKPLRPSAAWPPDPPSQPPIQPRFSGPPAAPQIPIEVAPRRPSPTVAVWPERPSVLAKVDDQQTAVEPLPDETRSETPQPRDPFSKTTQSSKPAVAEGSAVIQPRPLNTPLVEVENNEASGSAADLAATTIEISIGRIELRPPAPQPMTGPRPRFQPTVSLDEYLQKRRGER